jgi:DNA helicase-2/ATP-dependent DNA helicase PcrA
MIYDTITTIDNPIERFLKSINYEKMIENKYESEELKIEDKLENIKLLQDLYKEYTFDIKGIRDFLDSLIEIEKKDKDRDKVKISTIHSAKGLEWKHVFVGCCNERILPFYKDYLTNLKRDAELRLFYVAISRAKDKLTLSFSYKHRWQILPPSQFLDIIEEHKIIG